MEKMNRYLGESSDSPSVSELNDKEGKSIAKKLDAKYLGFKSDYNTYWFDDKKYGSSFTGRTYDEALKHRNDLWHRFKKHS